ncbi:MAG: pentapeptide repeat-containing protein, partial [bacterium]
RSANLLGATLKDTNFTGANLKNARLNKSQFCRTKTSVGMMNPNCRD